MEPIIETFTGNVVQCWSCPVFDKLFQVISAAAATLYNSMALVAAVMLCLFIAFYVLWAFWKNISGDKPDPMYQKYLKPVIINSLFVFALLGLGVMVPRLISQMSFEPITNMTVVYTQSMLNTTTEKVESKVKYEAQPMTADGFYRPQLRDSIILLMKTSITEFQAMIKMGMTIMDRAFSWTALLGPGAIVKHIMMFFMGLFIAWQFFRLFIKFCFYFADVIINLTFFAFFFPIMLGLWVMKNSELKDSKSLGWLANISSNITPKYFQNVINSIVSLATVVITYVVIMVIVAKFFSDPNVDSTALAQKIMSGDLFTSDLSDANIEMMTLGSVLVLVYVVRYLGDNIGKVAEAITETFNIKVDEKSAGNSLGEDALKIGKNAFDFAKSTGKILYNAATGKEPEKKEEKKEDKKEEKK